MRQTPTLKPLPQLRRRAWLTGTRAWLVGLGLVAVLLVALIARDTVFAQPAAVAIRTATADRGTVTSVVSGTGSLLPAGRMNVNFKVAGTLTEVDVKVGDKVAAGAVLARLDSTSQQAALAQAQASLASAQANLQAAQSPVTAAQLAQLQHQLSAAQQNYNDTVASVNAQNQADATTIANDQARVNADCPNGAQCSQDRAQLSNDTTKQTMDAISGQSRINSAVQQITSSRDNLTVQTQVKPNSVAAAQAQVASAQAQVQAAQLTLNETTLTSPTSGVIVSINGVPGESVAGGGTGATAQAPGTLAPQPSSSSAASSGFMMIDDNSSYVAVMPFAETDAARLAANQTTALTFDAIPGLTISGHVLGISPSATIVSNVVDYYVSFVLNRTDPRLRAGMTANASITVAQADNAVRVPNAAVHTQGGTTMVTVLSNGQQVATEVVTGVVGDTYTEIKAGLNEGDRVVLPALRTPGSTGTGGNLIRGGGGGFGGGGVVRGGG
jgi:multidrug efflux pump subunit AcrA (membrane-fusion protein)